MKKVLILTIVLVLLTQFVVAVPAPESPKCKINANVIDVNHIKEHKCPMQDRIVPSYYQIKSKINYLIERESGCENLYKPDSEITIKSSSKLKNGQVIEGQIKFQGDECNGGIFLKEYQVVKQAPKKCFFCTIFNWFKSLFKKN